MEEEKSVKTRYSREELDQLIRKRNLLRAQRNRMTYGLSLGAVLLFFGIAGGQLGLILAAGLIFAVGGYFMLEIIKQSKNAESVLRRYYPDGIPDRPSETNKK